jgi:uncharacterized protein YndB with AHSA1/START domain
MSDTERIPTCAIEITEGGADFRAIKRAGRSWGNCRYLKVTGAGQIVVRFKLPRDGHETETLTMEAGEVLPGQVVELVAADNACFPVKAWL